MTKTSFDVYMLFTLFDNLNVYEVLFIICNTDTNLYDFYIKKKSNFFPGWIYSLLSFMNKHVDSINVESSFFVFYKIIVHETTVKQARVLCNECYKTVGGANVYLEDSHLETYIFKNVRIFYIYNIML